jgi:hypothetical protein
MVQRWLGAERWRSLSRPFGRLRRNTGGPNAQAVPAAPKLYAALGVAASAEDWEIDVAYRRRAAQISSSQFAKPRQLKELNAAYEVLGNPARRAEYDRQVAEGTEESGYAQTLVPELDPPRGSAQYPRFHHPQRARPSGRGYSELLGLIVVVAVAILAGRYLLERVEVDLSGITAITSGLAVSHFGPSRAHLLRPPRRRRRLDRRRRRALLQCQWRVRPRRSRPPHRLPARRHCANNSTGPRPRSPIRGPDRTLP